MPERSMSRADRAGIWLSGACVVHCIATPLLLSLSPAIAHLLPGEEWLHRSLAVIIAAVGGMALVCGYRLHGRKLVLSFLVMGLGCIGFTAWFGERLPTHVCEVSLTLLGSVLLIAAHRLNHTFCRNCACASAACR